MRFSRRRFLAGAAGALALPAAGCGPSSGPSRVIEGGVVGASHRVGHLLREAAAAAAGPVEEVTTGVAIVGAGVSGLSAAWKLARSGADDWLVMDLEPEAGGTARWGEAGSGRYPWGAHYLPLPSEESRAVRELLEDLGVIEGHGADGRPIYGERHMCYAPQERLFLHGRWQTGLFPTIGLRNEDQAQLVRFRSLMAAYRNRKDGEGRRAFSLPMELSSRDPELLALDRISMREYLDRERLDSPRLRWYVEYACRDDYGCDLATTSAWAGIHYYASRPDGDEGQVLTWPEGNGWIARQLAARCGKRLRTGLLVQSVEPGESGVTIRARDVTSGRAVRIRAGHAVLAVPKFVTRRLLPALAARHADWSAYSYSPWMVANLHVDRVPRGTGAPPCWDNVLYESPSLGYITSTHQQVSAHPTQSVLTYYLPFPAGDPAAVRQRMLDTSWASWRDTILADLRRAHPDLEKLVSRIDVMLWGHAMVRPTVGFLWGEARRRGTEPAGRVQLAHADCSGLPLFEEAQYRGVQAAERILAELGRTFRSSL